MKTIVISGSRSNVGKTFLAEKLLRCLPGWSALKVTVAGKGLGCSRIPADLTIGGRVKANCRVCSEMKKDFDIVTAEKIIGRTGTDTGRMKRAGAKKTIWLKARLRGLKQGLKKALSHLKDSEGVVIEGTSVLQYITPDLAIFLQGQDRNFSPKPSAEAARKKADIVIHVNG